MTSHRVAIITGASTGIGAGLVAGYRSRDWAVVASARAIRPSQDPDLLAVAADITEPATADRIVEAALDRFGRIDTPMRPAGYYDGPGSWVPPLGCVGQVSDVIDGVLFLESSPYITGEFLHIDGGQAAGHSSPLG